MKELRDHVLRKIVNIVFYFISSDNVPGNSKELWMEIVREIMDDKRIMKKIDNEMKIE